jgi:hypothetical protein|tara:strand:- start:2456 stop:2833 length:378 start_codon:yes stop_codon:yes gene_type:complete
MSDYNGFSFDLEGNGKKITKDRVDKVLEVKDGSNEWNIIEEVLEIEDGNIILMGDNEDPWRYNYANEVLHLMITLQEELDFTFKGEFVWMSDDYQNSYTNTYTFDGSGDYEEEFEEEEHEWYEDE